MNLGFLDEAISTRIIPVKNQEHDANAISSLGRSCELREVGPMSTEQLPNGSLASYSAIHWSSKPPDCENSFPRSGVLAVIFALGNLPRLSNVISCEDSAQRQCMSVDYPKDFRISSYVMALMEWYLSPCPWHGPRSKDVLFHLACTCGWYRACAKHEAQWTRNPFTLNWALGGS